MVPRFDAFCPTPYAVRAMLDIPLRRYILPILATPAARVAALGSSVNSLRVAGFVVGIAALPAIGRHAYLLGLALVAVGRLLDVMASAGASLKPRERYDRYLSLVLDIIWTASMALAFALGEPNRALAAMFLMFGLVARAAALSAEAQVMPGPVASMQGFGATLIGKTEIFVAYVLSCIFPDRFSIIAYALGMVCFVMTGSLVASAGSRDK